MNAGTIVQILALPFSNCDSGQVTQTLSCSRKLPSLSYSVTGNLNRFSVPRFPRKAGLSASGLQLKMQRSPIAPCFMLLQILARYVCYSSFTLGYNNLFPFLSSIGLGASRGNHSAHTLRNGASAEPCHSSLLAE